MLTVKNSRKRVFAPCPGDHRRQRNPLPPASAPYDRSYMSHYLATPETPVLVWVHLED